MAEELSAEEKAELARIRAEKEKARKLACIEAATKLVEGAAVALLGIDHETADEVRIGVMSALREAINHIHEAG